VDRILRKAEIKTVPEAAVAVFVGKEFDSLNGRGGGDEPVRRTPWGEIAWQIGKHDSFKVIGQHEREYLEPKGDAIRAMLPKDRPVLILMDENISYGAGHLRRRQQPRTAAIPATGRGNLRGAVLRVISAPSFPGGIVPSLSRHSYRPRVEFLETRLAPAIFTVKNLLDDGSANTLRGRIEAADLNPGLDTVVFRAGLKSSSGLPGRSKSPTTWFCADRALGCSRSMALPPTASFRSMTQASWPM
jgi:hypothetical protein